MFDPWFRVGFESGWYYEYVNAFSSKFQSQAGDMVGGLGQAKTKAPAQVRLKFVQLNVYE